MFELRSSAFVSGGELPRRFTCEGTDHSPPLDWTDVPQSARSLALLVEGSAQRVVDATFTHWLVFDLPVNGAELRESLNAGELPLGAKVGMNGWGRASWGGPCPTHGRQRYRFQLFALDLPLGELSPPTSEQLRKVIEGHLVAETELIGTYERQILGW